MLCRVRHRNTTLAHIVRIDHAAQSIGSLRLPMRRSQIAAEPAAPPDLYLPAIAPDRRSTPSPGRRGQGSMSGSGLGCVKTRLRLKSAELFSQFSSSDRCNQIQCSFGAAKLTRSFCGQIGSLRFHAAWVKRQHSCTFSAFPLYLRKQTSTVYEYTP